MASNRQIDRVLLLFHEKLRAKNQSESQRKQAYQAVTIYYETVISDKNVQRSSPPAAVPPKGAGADFTLATHLGSGDGGIFLVQDGDGTGGDQETDDAIGAGTRAETVMVMQYCRDNAGGAIGRRCDDPSARRVFFVDRQGVEVHPVQDGQGVAQGGCTTCGRDRQPGV